MRLFSFKKMKVSVQILLPTIVVLLIVFASIGISVNRSNTANANSLSAMRAKEMLGVLDYVVHGKMRIEEPVDGSYKGIQDFVESTTLGKNGYFFVMDHNGIVLHHLKRAVIGKDLLYLPYVKEMIKNKNGVITYTFQGKTKVVAYRTVPENGWVLGAGYEVNELFAPFRALERRVGILSTVGLIAILIVILLNTRMLQKNVKKTLTSFIEVAKGNLFTEDSNGTPCWQVIACEDKECPAYGQSLLPCHLTVGSEAINFGLDVKCKHIKD